MKKLWYYWEQLNASFWFVPMLILILAVGGSFLLIAFDNYISFTPQGFLKYLFTGSADSARSILSTIAGAMISVAGVVFSITLVALTLASSQFGHRLLRNFMYDKVNQVVLGTYVSTFVYCLIILNAVKSESNEDFVPLISVLVAILLAVLNIILLIIFIHHIAISIQSDSVISNISSGMSKNIKNLFPVGIGREDSDEKPDLDYIFDSYKILEEIHAKQNGYLQTIDNDRLIKMAEENDLLIELKFRPGDYVVKDAAMCYIRSNEKLRHSDIKKITDGFITGKVRTPMQDAEYALHQMVEIAIRALSPGINDPYTANACINNLTAELCYLTGIRFPSKYRYDSDNLLRIIAESPTFDGMLGAAFNQIRQYAEGSPPVVIRLMDALITISRFAGNAEQQSAIHLHADMVWNTAQRSFKEKHDLEVIRERYDRINDKR